MPIPNNLWSLQNLNPGTYLLDVIVDMSSSGILGVYETILVILVPSQPPLAPTTVINQLSILIETELIFDGDDNETDSGDNQTDSGDNQTDSGDNKTGLTREPPICPLDAEGNEVCPPTDELTPIPGPPPPECPDAGPEVCGEDTPLPPDSDADADNGNGNGEAGGDGNGEGGSNGNGQGGGNSNDNNGGTFDGGGLFFD